ncbi:hypothetical protein ACIQZN_09270 [Streptomyces sp. NPDC097595]|uniref:hypothetical protein n=1 Tax=Streptomyces sp. NPDC097595 TaxID=3366090 RepID=UPI0037F1E442
MLSLLALGSAAPTAQLAAVHVDGSGDFAVVFNTVLVVGITVGVLVTQFTAREVTPRMYFWCALLVARGCVPPGPSEATKGGIGFLVLALAISVVFGALRARSMPMWRDTAGKVIRKGGMTTMWLWLATIAARLVVGAIAHMTTGEPINVNALWLGMGVTLLVQQYFLGLRAKDSTLPVRESAAPAAGPRTSE